MAFGCLALLAVSARPAAQAPTGDALLSRAASYVARYFSVISNLLAEEHYVQDVVIARPMIPTSVGRVGPAGMVGLQKRAHDRELRADVTLVNVGPPIEWRVYRDVYEVDGRPVRDRTDRLAKLILAPAASARAQADRIAEESARFNISNVGRWLNEPGLSLVFLQPSLQARFEFTVEKRDGRAWIVRYEERVRPTIFRHNKIDDNPSSGRFWIDADTGAVTKTELIVSPSSLKATFTTTFRRDDGFGIWLPDRMHEQLWTSVELNARRLEGTAEYAKYRRFGVTTQEKFR